MLARNLTNKILDIRLEEEKFYFPGETIKGLVIVHPKSAIKVNSIQLKFVGEVYINLKEKEYNTLFQKTLALSVYPNSTTPKQTTLDATEHSFPFEFIVPKSADLPSSMEFGKKGHIRYTIHAVLDRPMIPESLCPKTDYIVSLLEYIDIEQPQFKVPQEKSQDIMLPKAKYNQKCMVRASMPRLGFTRGDIVPLKVMIDHFTSYERKHGVTVDLVRTVEIRTTRHTIFKEAVLKSTPYDMHMTEQQQQQIITCQILIPTSTPPSIRYKDKMLRFHYKVRISADFGKKVVCALDLPIVIGTWPRAAVPIDDDDDDDDNEQEDKQSSFHLDSSIMTETEDEDESYKTCSLDDTRHHAPSWQAISAQQKTSEWQVSRSDSVHSKTSSISSYEQHNYYQHNNNLSRNTSQCTTVSSPDRLPSYYNNLNANGHHRSSSIYSIEYPSSYHQRLSMASMPPLVTQNPPPPPQQLNYRFPMTRYNARLDDETPSILLETDVPTHILEPISTAPQHKTDNVSDSSSFEDSDEEDDLLAIIERKKKKEQKASRKKAFS